MERSPHDLNKKGKLTHLLADDLFANDLKQVFSPKTGKQVGYIRDGLITILPDEDNPPDDPPETTTDPQQLYLF